MVKCLLSLEDLPLWIPRSQPISHSTCLSSRVRGVRQGWALPTKLGQLHMGPGLPVVLLDQACFAACRGRAPGMAFFVWASHWQPTFWPPSQGKTNFQETSAGVAAGHSIWLVLVSQGGTVKDSWHCGCLETSVHWTVRPGAQVFLRQRPATLLWLDRCCQVSGGSALLVLLFQAQLGPARERQGCGRLAPPAHCC